jgi:hypothetical protein
LVGSIRTGGMKRAWRSADEWIKLCTCVVNDLLGARDWLEEQA